ncbi:TetR/AcrR family transcriptional regulator [Streptomyces sp. ISL-12]|uniref:TetR/AcrR family transcriptional regulator n=1 Tax=Streptomyces sp. ISL-12 TaxID=2819177 RepID=UPI001BE99332|nr:TetR/AcrR family transcriptional regulator [Streptomyces sp. ISL-12]MBT2413286.1 TetR/AcrR family transcriptional regulator [Streptomyces sp. ISL-12]
MSPRKSTRNQLIASAEEVFYSRGIGATSVDVVAQEAGVSKPTVYAHFAGKSELAATALRHRHDQAAAELADWLAGVEEPGDRPQAVFSWLAHRYRTKGRRGCAFLNAAAETVDPEDPVHHAVRAEKRWLLDLLTTLCAEAGTAAPELRASQLLLLIDGVAGRVVVEGPQAAARAVSDAAAAAAVLLAAGTS